MNRTGIVVLGDVVASRKIGDRESFVRELRAVLDDVNEQHEDHLTAEFTTIKGIDEVGGVLDSPAPLFHIQRELTERVHPESIRIVAVEGRLDVTFPGSPVNELDGPAFARGDELLDSLKRTGFLFEMDVRDDPYERLLVDQVNLLSFLKLGWTEHQLRVARLYRERGVQTAVADELGVSQQAVSKTLREARASQVLAVEKRLDAIFEDANIEPSR